jgi:hypothetical protein
VPGGVPRTGTSILTFLVFLPYDFTPSTA